MIEQLLINSGLKCGSLKNFNTQILEDQRRATSNHWYFLTPIKVKDNGSGYKEATINFGFPLNVAKDEVDESKALLRISEIKTDYEKDLIKFLRTLFQVPSYEFSVHIFWANEKGERTERKDIGNVRIHLLNGRVTVKYRDSWFNCSCS